MKKRMIILLTSFILLSGCQKSGNDTKTSGTKQPAVEHEKVMETRSAQTFPYPNLLAQDDQTYSLLVIGVDDEQAPIEKNRTITKHVTNILSLPTVDMVQKAYPKLTINTKVSYILFDQAGMVHQSKTLKELTNYLEKNQPTN